MSVHTWVIFAAQDPFCLDWVLDDTVDYKASECRPIKKVWFVGELKHTIQMKRHVSHMCAARNWRGQSGFTLRHNATFYNMMFVRKNLSPFVYMPLKLTKRLLSYVLVDIPGLLACTYTKYIPFLNEHLPNALSSIVMSYATIAPIESVDEPTVLL